MRLLLLALCLFPMLLSGQPDRAAMTRATAETQRPVAAGGGGDISSANLVARWKWDEGTGGSGTTTADATANGHTGTLNGSTGWHSPGKVGSSSISFPGTTGSGVSITPFATGTTYTYCVWIYHISGTGFQNLIGQSGSFGIWLSSGKINCFFSGGSAVSSTSISDNTWHHIAVVNSAGAVTIYLDGVADGTASTGTSFDINGIGADSGNGGEAFNGYQDDGRLYSRALTSGEITTLNAFTGP